MDIREILELLGMVAGTAALAFLFFFYFTNDKVKGIVDKVIKYIPAALSIGGRFVKDKEGVFDTHDMLQVTARLTAFLEQTLADPLNNTFADVEEETFDFLSRELNAYKKAGVSGVPDISDEVLRVNVKVVFKQISQAMYENPTRNDS
jgi:hypothetical protein